MVSDVRVDGGAVHGRAPAGHRQARGAASSSARAIEAVVGAAAGRARASSVARRAARTRDAGAIRSPGARALPGVQHVIAVSSAKGGVGKSTVAANLAVALARDGQRRRRSLDADVYGPSVPIMFGVPRRGRR